MQTSTLKLINSAKNQIKLILEPWAEEYQIEAGKVVEIVGEGKTDSCIEVEYDGEDIIVYGWSDSMTVRSNGEKLEPNFD